MSKYLPLLVIFGIDIFFACFAIVNLEYLGKESSSIYIIFNIMTFALGVLLFCYDAFYCRKTFTSKQILLLSIPFIITSCFLVTLALLKINSMSEMYFIYFVLWGFPAILVGIHLADDNGVYNMGKYMEIVMIIFTVASIRSSIPSILYGVTVNIGGATYQNASYIAAFAFGLNLYYLIYGKNHIRFKFTSWKIYRVIFYTMLFVQIIGILTSGGRGGMVLAITYCLYITFERFKSRRINSVNIIIIAIVIFTILIISIPILSEIPAIKNGFARTFEYISAGEINFAGSSGRDVIYNNAIDLVFKSPVFGYGFYAIWDSFNSLPHNLFLEVMLQGGIILLVFFLIVLAKAIRKLNRIIKQDQRVRIVFIIALYPAILLMFSGTYTSNTLFWFVLSFIFSLKRNTNQSKVM